MTTMNILVISEFPIPHSGGASAHVEDLIACLKCDAHEVNLIEVTVINICSVSAISICPPLRSIKDTEFNQSYLLSQLVVRE